MKNKLAWFITLLLIYACDNEVKQKIEVLPLIKLHPAEVFYHDSKIFPLISALFIDSTKTLIEEFYHRRFDTIDFSGGFLVAKNGQVIFESYAGNSDYQLNTKNSANTPLHVASISKVLTSTALFRLIDKEMVQLDDLVQEILPEFPYSDITFRMLLNHRSGLPHYSKFKFEPGIWDDSKIQTNDDVLNILVTEQPKLLSVPGTKFNYCNTNFVVIALAIEKLTQLSFPKAMKKLVFDPLNMEHTFVFEYPVHHNKVSNSYTSKLEFVPFNFLDGIYGDKNCYSTPQDLLRFDLSTYNDTFVSKKIKAEAYRGYSYEKPGVKNYGLGIRIKEWENNQRMFYHTGWWHGNTANYISVKSDTLTIVVLSNKYTKKVYESFRITGLFGYPFKLSDDETEVVIK